MPDIPAAEGRGGAGAYPKSASDDPVYLPVEALPTSSYPYQPDPAAPRIPAPTLVPDGVIDNAVRVKADFARDGENDITMGGIINIGTETKRIVVTNSGATGFEGHNSVPQMPVMPVLPNVPPVVWWW